ncbi:MAG: hypothetical protein ACFE9C_08515 [Candidatus Hodarchaeota archaeon]
MSIDSAVLYGEYTILMIGLIYGNLKYITCSFILVEFILLFTNLLIVIFIHSIPENYQCPECKSKEFIDYGETIECRHCGLELFKEFLNSEIDEENLLSADELDSIAESFQDELKDEKTRKKFRESIEKDQQDTLE